MLENLKSDFNKYWVPWVWFTKPSRPGPQGWTNLWRHRCLMLDVSQLRTWILGSPFSGFRIFLVLKTFEAPTIHHTFFWSDGI